MKDRNRINVCFAVVFPARTLGGLAVPVLDSEHKSLPDAMTQAKRLLAAARFAWVERWIDAGDGDTRPKVVRVTGEQAEAIVLKFKRRKKPHA